jgi:hypothetical protein
MVMNLASGSLVSHSAAPLFSSCGAVWERYQMICVIFITCWPGVPSAMAKSSSAASPTLIGSG